MNVLDAVGISLPCRSCGNNYQVPLRDVLLSHTMLHQGCTVSQETECPPVFQSRLFERKDIEELERAWNHMEQRARGDGGELVLMAPYSSAEVRPSVHEQPITGTEERPEASVPPTTLSRNTRESVNRSSKREKAKTQKRAHSKTMTRNNKKIA